MAYELALIISVTTLCMLSPGPDMALVIRNTLTGDRASGLYTSLGVLTGNAVHRLLRAGHRRVDRAQRRRVQRAQVRWRVLHLPWVRALLARSRQTVERSFGVVLVLIGLGVASQD